MPARRATSVSCRRPSRRRRHVQQKLRVAADRREVEIHEVVDDRTFAVFRRVVEPARADRDVGSRPGATRCRSDRRAAAARDAAPSDAGDADHVGIDSGPVRIAGDAALVADPADVGSGVGEDHRVRLQLAHESPDARPVVLLLLAVRPFAVGAVEPDLVDRAVARQQLGELVAVEVVVARRVAVRRVRCGPTARDRGRRFSPSARHASTNSRTTSPLAAAKRARSPPSDRSSRVGQRQKPSWCFAVRIIARKPPAFAARAHCRASSFAGAKIDGLSLPSPHSRSVKVLTPKCRNSASSSRCHSSCDGGGNGACRGGGPTSARGDAGGADRHQERATGDCFGHYGFSA